MEKGVSCECDLIKPYMAREIKEREERELNVRKKNRGEKRKKNTAKRNITLIAGEYKAQ